MAAVGAKTTGPVVVIFEPGYLFATAAGNVRARTPRRQTAAQQRPRLVPFEVCAAAAVPPCVTTRPSPRWQSMRWLIMPVWQRSALVFCGVHVGDGHLPFARFCTIELFLNIPQFKRVYVDQRDSCGHHMLSKTICHRQNIHPF
jgi:hypothetical protein